MLRDKGFRATGTIRENRTNKCPLPPKESMNKEERGHFRYMFDKTNSLLFVKWKDSNVVTMGTNYDTIEPQSKVKRWSSVKKEKVDVPQPQLFRKYNSSMGGVDLLDQGVNNYRISIQGKKWYWVIFTHMVNTALVNAWRIHMLNSGKQKVDLLSFIRSVTRHYLRCFSKASYSKTRPSPPVPTSIVQDEGGHFPGKNEKQLRCRQCHLRARWKCIKCNVVRDLAKILLLLNRPIDKIAVPDDWEHLFGWAEKALNRYKRMSGTSNQPQVAQLINFLQGPTDSSEYSLRGSTTLSTFKPDFQPSLAAMEGCSRLSLQDVAIDNFTSNYDSKFHQPLNPQWKFEYSLVANNSSEFDPALWRNSKEYLNGSLFLEDDFCQLGFRPQDEITTEL
nr:unnamed protein product [Callosobruchus chinensis]